jgi:hypothetical protein
VNPNCDPFPISTYPGRLELIKAMRGEYHGQADHVKKYYRKLIVTENIKYARSWPPERCNVMTR